MGINDNKAVARRWVEATKEKRRDLLDDLFTADPYDNVGQRTVVDWWKEVFGFLYEPCRTGLGRSTTSWPKGTASWRG